MEIAYVSFISSSCWPFEGASVTWKAVPSPRGWGLGEDGALLRDQPGAGDSSLLGTGGLL